MFDAAAFRRIALTPSIVLLAAAGGCSATSNSSARDDRPQSDRRPVAAGSAFAEDLEGRAVAPLADSTDRVVVLTFVRTDCPIANRYAPTVRRLREEFTPQGASFYLVYPNPDATADEIRAHLNEYAWGIPALRDPQHALVNLVGATVTPEVAVFNRDSALVYHGRIDNRYVDFGKTRPAPTRHELEDAIAAALAEVPVSVPETKAVGCFIADLK